MAFNDFYKGKRVLLTGDTGFKGSWLAIWLRELGAEVFGYALPPKGEDNNFCQCGLADKIVHRDGDVRDLAGMKYFFQRVQPDVAFHLAAQPLVLLSYENPVETFDTNLMGVVNFFEAVRSTSSVRSAVNITSDKCYDNRETIYGYREHDAMGGKDPYSASKGAAEIITSSYIQSFFKAGAQANVASARAGNVIGGGDWADNRIVPDYFRAYRKKETLQIRNPDSTRPWQHVMEPLSGYLQLGWKLFSEGEAYMSGWNFGPDASSEYSVADLIGRMNKVCEVPYEIVSNDLQEANLLKLDITKAHKFLKWRPVLNFFETVDFTLDGYLHANKESDVYQLRVKQIAEYTKLATERKIKWALEA